LRLLDEQLRRRECGRLPGVDEDLGGSSRAKAPAKSFMNPRASIADQFSTQL
jgi:hypothetical protein